MISYETKETHYAERWSKLTEVEGWETQTEGWCRRGHRVVVWEDILIHLVFIPLL
jgi:hypothetical protein